MTPGGDDGGSEPSYGEALEELEDLLDELEGADVDVDVLARRVARGVELIRLCRARLDVVSTDVDAVVAELVALDQPGEQATVADEEPSEATTGNEAEPAERAAGAETE